MIITEAMIEAGRIAVQQVMGDPQFWVEDGTLAAIHLAMDAARPVGDDAGLAKQLLTEADGYDALVKTVAALAEKHGVAGEWAGKTVQSLGGRVMRQAAARIQALSAPSE